MHDLITITARIDLVATRDGGRQKGIRSGYRPNHVFEKPLVAGKLTSYLGEIKFDDKETLEPGRSRVVRVQFLKVPAVKRFMKPMRRWYLHEGTKLVGYGTILEVKGEQESK
ncbi:hypothetical protein [Flavihumibacter petaseus]|uniref:Translation elongation factor EFTu/EF1A C-terminal domain-containing protein n=1 Tax=Flavihumibacter petaseus NBRC 106054 TaxID=1220578 RepID=A0A0E9MY69_9BACT|nr:hypothetical protein [Flavihumibacter petaseus]GAO42534.1 hypothetical protein FPE01S_01_15490 [Flavihumibacter petaseus NBRC 106054]